MRQCEIYLHGIKCGLLTEEDDKSFTFSYDSVYLQRADADPVSLTLPLQREPHKSPLATASLTKSAKSPYLFSAFSNMLSEGENRQVQSVLLRIDPDDDFGILLATCQTDTIGAITVKPIRL